jgi:hypothetical protein
MALQRPTLWSHSTRCMYIIAISLLLSDFSGTGLEPLVALTTLKSETQTFKARIRCLTPTSTPAPMSPTAAGRSLPSSSSLISPPTRVTRWQATGSQRARLIRLSVFAVSGRYLPLARTRLTVGLAVLSKDRFRQRRCDRGPDYYTEGSPFEFDWILLESRRWVRSRTQQWSRWLQDGQVRRRDQLGH